MAYKTIGAVASVFFNAWLTHDSASAALIWTSLDTSCFQGFTWISSSKIFQMRTYLFKKNKNKKPQILWSTFPKTGIFSRDIRVSDWAQGVGSQWIALICSNPKVTVWLQKAFGNSSHCGYIPAQVNWQEKQNICEIQLNHTVRVHVLQLL